MSVRKFVGKTAFFLMVCTLGMLAYTGCYTAPSYYADISKVPPESLEATKFEGTWSYEEFDPQKNRSKNNMTSQYKITYLFKGNTYVFSRWFFDGPFTGSVTWEKGYFSFTDEKLTLYGIELFNNNTVGSTMWQDKMALTRSGLNQMWAGSGDKYIDKVNAVDRRYFFNSSGNLTFVERNVQLEFTKEETPMKMPTEYAFLKVKNSGFGYGSGDNSFIITQIDGIAAASNSVESSVQSIVPKVVESGTHKISFTAKYVLHSVGKEMTITGHFTYNFHSDVRYGFGFFTPEYKPRDLPDNLREIPDGYTRIVINRLSVDGSYNYDGHIDIPTTK